MKTSQTTCQDLFDIIINGKCNWHIDQDEDGQLVIQTGLTIDDNDNVVPIKSNLVLVDKWKVR